MNTAEELRAQVAALSKQIDEYSWCDGEEEQAGEAICDLQAQRASLESELSGELR